MSEFLASPWLPTSSLIAMALIARIVRGTWLSPAAFIALIWAVYTTGCLLLTDYEVFPVGPWVIVLFVGCVQFGTVLSEGVGAMSRDASQAPSLEVHPSQMWSDRCFKSTALFTLVALAGTIYLLMFSLQKFELGFSFMELLSLGHLWSVARYSGDVEPWSVRLLIMWVYPAGLLAGVCFALARRRIHKIVSFAPFLPAALIGTLFAVRAGLLFSIVCWLSGFLAIRYIESGGKFALFQKKFLISILALAVCGFLFFVAIDTLRIFQRGDDVQVRLDGSRIYKYCFGAVPAFSAWLHFGRAEEPTWGAYTFSGVFELLGIRRRQVGVYGDYLTLAGGEDTNIYTFLRGLIEDFTIAGACLFGIVLGIVAGSATRRQSTGHVLTLAGYYAFILFSPIISLFAYNGLILAWAVSVLILGWPSHSRTFESQYPVPA